MAETILKIVGSNNAPLAMAIAGYIVSIPVFAIQVLLFYRP